MQHFDFDNKRQFRETGYRTKKIKKIGEIRCILDKILEVSWIIDWIEEEAYVVFRDFTQSCKPDALADIFRFFRTKDLRSRPNAGAAAIFRNLLETNACGENLSGD